MKGMGLTKVQAAALAAIAMLAVAAACILPSNYFGPSRQGQGQPPQAPVVVRDILGRNVTLPSKVERVVAIGPGMLRLVCYLNATNLLVGVEEIETRWGFAGRDYAMAQGERFKSLPVVGPGGPGKPPAPELIIAARPDVVIMSRTYCDFYNPDRLQREVNATLIVMDYGPAGYLDVEAISKALTTLGRVLNREERARQLVDFIRSLCNDLNGRTKDVSPRPKAYAGAVSYKGPQPFTSTQSPFPPLALLNTPSIADRYARTSGFVSLDFEAIIDEQPDVIFIDENNLQTVKQDFAKDPNKYLRLNAFREGRVYGTLPYNYYHTNIAVALADAYYMGKVLYPDRFEGVDPEKKADEIFQVFLGRPLYRDYAEAFGGFKRLSELFKVP
jgi:iron complex transport system substrate-binding protein